MQISPLGHPLPPALAVGLLSGWTLDPGAGTACGGLGVVDVGYEAVSLKGQEPGRDQGEGALELPWGGRWQLAGEPSGSWKVREMQSCLLGAAPGWARLPAQLYLGARVT